MGPPRVGSNPTGSDLLECRNGRPSGVAQRAGFCYKGRGVLASDAARWRISSSGAARAFIGVISFSLAQPPPLAATACALRQRFLLPPIVATAKGARACGPRRAMARGRRTSYKRTNQTRYASATVAILAQGTSWAVAVTQAYLRCPKLRLAHLGPGMHLAYRASRDSHHCKQPPVWLAQSGSLLGIQMGSPITASGLQSGLLRCQPERMPGRSLARSLLPAQYTFCRVLDCTGHILHAGLRSVQRSCNRSDLQTPSRTN